MVASNEGYGWLFPFWGIDRILIMDLLLRMTFCIHVLCFLMFEKFSGMICLASVYAVGLVVLIQWSYCVNSSKVYNTVLCTLLCNFSLQLSRCN